LSSLKYSQKKLLRLTFQSHSFNDRAEQIMNYLVSYNPHLEKRIGQMNSITKRLFYKEVRDDAQFDWYLNQYPELKLYQTYMQPGLSGLHISDSVSRDIY